MPTKWQNRYGSVRAVRATRIYLDQPPLAVAGKPPGNAAFLWSAQPQTAGAPGTVVTLNNHQFKGYLELYAAAANLQSIWVRSQRCTETFQGWYSNQTYEVKLRRLRNDRLIPTSCTCPDFVHRHTTHPACKHMIAVRKSLINPNPNAYPPQNPQNNDDDDDDDDDDNNDNDNNDDDDDDDNQNEEEETEEEPQRNYRLFPRRTGRRSQAPQRGAEEGYSFSNTGQAARGPRRSGRQRAAPSRLVQTMEAAVGAGIDDTHKAQGEVVGKHGFIF